MKIEVIKMIRKIKEKSINKKYLKLLFNKYL